jgi:hypothetical protein
LLSSLQVIQKASAGGNQFQKAAAGRMIFAVTLQVIRKLIDPAGQKRDLYVGTSGVVIVQPERAKIDVVTRGHSIGSKEDKGEVPARKQLFVTDRQQGQAWQRVEVNRTLR